MTSESCRWLLRGSGEDLSACAVFKERDGTVFVLLIYFIFDVFVIFIYFSSDSF